MNKKRILLVDDSGVSRMVLRRILREDNRFEIVAEGRNGIEAVEKTVSHQPDLVIMDVMMPERDGIEATKEIMAAHPTPILIMSELVGKDAALNFRALRAGALEVIRKPTFEQSADPEYTKALGRKLRVLAGVPLITRRQRASARADLVQTRTPDKNGAGINLLLIGASTGGPPAIQTILSGLRDRLHIPIVIVQHMTPGFLEGLARWLTDTTGIDSRVAADGEYPAPGVAYFAPDHAHTELEGSRIRLRGDAPRNGHRPSVDTLFESAAKSGKSHETGAVLLTGMGVDGAEGLLSLRRAGAWTCAQDEASSAVFGMPKAAIDRSAATEVCSHLTMAEKIAGLQKKKAGA